MSADGADSRAAAAAQSPERPSLVLGALILVATVANLNLSVANVALPEIGRDFDASQTELNLVAVCYSLGLAATVLYLGAIGDRYGRKLMLELGVIVSIPACLIAAYAPNIEVLIAGRLLGGLGAGMAFPTTLALITALWSGPGRTRAIALWSGIGGAMNAVGPIVSGILLSVFAWHSVFILTLPLAVVALVLARRAIPAHVGENDESVDHPGGILSAVMIAALALGINFAGIPGALEFGLAMIGVAIFTGVLFFVRQRRASFPLFDLRYARRPTFWVAATAGMVVFGSLMGALFIGQQFLQNVLGYSTLEAGLSIIPGALSMMLIAPRSASVVEARGARFTLLLGYSLCLVGFVLMLVLFGEETPYWHVAVAFTLIGAGVGFAGTPASHSLTGSVPVSKAGMASGTADLQRDLGGAILQSLLGALLTAGYAGEFAKQIAASPQAGSVSSETEAQLEKSFSSAAQMAERYPEYSKQIVNAAKESFLHGQDLAYGAGVLAIGLGALLVWRFFPGREEEQLLLAGYAADDSAAEDGIS